MVDEAWHAAPAYTAAGVTLSRLVGVKVQDVWPTEPGYFTPWLLEHSDVLSETIGYDVQLEVREHQVGGFFLDLIGTEVENPDRRVIVENQYGPTDHRHLGQLLTYAGGTEPTTVIWIAEDFRDEHRAALDWLNANIDSDVRFFGIRLSVVRVAAGPETLVAPQFELIVKPNDYVAEAKRAAAHQDGGPSMKQLEYQEYWQTLEVDVHQRGWTNAKAPAKNWWNFSTGKSGAVWGLNFGKSGAKVELYLGDTDPATNTRRLMALRQHEDRIAAALPQPVVFADLPGKKACRVEVVLPTAAVEEEDRWSEYKEWMLDRLAKLREVIAEVGGIPT